MMFRNEGGELKEVGGCARVVVFVTAHAHIQRRMGISV
jgi:hypothetical protein